MKQWLKMQVEDATIRSRGGGIEKPEGFGEKTPPPPVPKALMLPWEAKRGFLLGLPATVWMFLRHPVRAYSCPTENRRYDAAGFNFFVLFFATMVVPLYDRFLFAIFGGMDGVVAERILGGLVLTDVASYWDYIDKYWMYFAGLIGLATRACSIINKLMSMLIVAKNGQIKYALVDRIYMYAWSAYFLVLVPAIYSTLVVFGYLFFCAIGTKIMSKVSWPAAIFIGVLPVVIVYSLIFTYFKVWYLFPGALYGWYFSS